jgi:hypothetical protein
METTVSGKDSHSAAALHARLQTATRDARRQLEADDATPRAAVRRRVSSAATWALLQDVRSTSAVDRTLPLDRALRRILASLLDDAGRGDVQTDLDIVEGPVLVIRSGPWPVLRALLARLRDNDAARPITVLCHHRDEVALRALGQDLGLDPVPLWYPRFEPFNTSTLRRLTDGGPWRSTFVLDASKAGRGDALEHVTTAMSSRHAYVWNAGGTAWRQRSLRERLDRERYTLVRGLLRWHAGQGVPQQPVRGLGRPQGS